MDSISEPEHIEWYHESMFATNFTIYTRYKNKSYKSTCIKSVMIESSIVIKNAMESEDTNVFYVPDNNEIEPNAFKSILTFIHISKVAHCTLVTNGEKNIQHMLLICNWFGITHLYKELIENYKTLLKESERTLNMFTQIDNIREFLDITQQKQNDDEPFFTNGQYNPICGLITGDKLNDSELIDHSLSLFDFDPLFLNVYKLFEGLCILLMTHLMRNKTKEKICMKLREIDNIYKNSHPKELKFSFSENYVRRKIDWSVLLKNPNSFEPYRIEFP